MMHNVKVIAGSILALSFLLLVCSCGSDNLGASAAPPVYSEVKTGCVSPAPINILTEALECKKGEQCNMAIEIEGGGNYYIWDESVTTLPVGLSFKEGVITGVPADVADATFQVSVSDAECLSTVAVKEIKLSIASEGVEGQDPLKPDLTKIEDFELQYDVDVAGDVKTIKPVFVACEGKFGTKDKNCEFYEIHSGKKTMRASSGDFNPICWAEGCVADGILSLDFTKRTYFAIFMHEPQDFPGEVLADQATFKEVRMAVKVGGEWHPICVAEPERTINAVKDDPNNSIYFTIIEGLGEPYITCK